RFVDEGKKGHDPRKRTQFHAMLAYCRDAWQRRQPVDAVVCWHPNRFSRADSIETSWFLHEFRQCGVERMFTSAGWVDFTRMEDRILFGITQDASSHKYSVDLAAASTRGKLDVARNGQFTVRGPAYR